MVSTNAAFCLNICPHFRHVTDYSLGNAFAGAGCISGIDTVTVYVFTVSNDPDIQAAFSENEFPLA